MMLRGLVSSMFVLVALMMIQAQMTKPSHAEDELLDPDVAFRFSARMLSNSMLEVQFQIADGYYMYRDSYRFSVQPESIALGEPQFSPGLWHEDEFFGRSEVFRDEVTIRLPLEPALQSLQSVQLVTMTQGCADIGVCYLPTKKVADFVAMGLPAGPR